MANQNERRISSQSVLKKGPDKRESSIVSILQERQQKSTTREKTIRAKGMRNLDAAELFNNIDHLFFDLNARKGGMEKKNAPSPSRELVDTGELTAQIKQAVPPVVNKLKERTLIQS